MQRSKPIIGLCGGIGSGKSRVAEEFAKLGCMVVDSDRLNHEVLQTPQVQAALREWWGPQIVRPDGTTDRARIAEIVFRDEEARRRLESLVHPLIGARREAMIRRGLEDPRVRAIILDSPLLFESGLDHLCDRIVFVDADEPARLRRVQAARHWDAAQLRERERRQQPIEHKRSRADYVVDNNGPAEALGKQVAEILRQVTSEGHVG